MRNVLASLLLLASAAASAVPVTPSLILNHHGRLLGADDKPVTGPVKIKFELHTLFASGAGDELVWSDEYAAVQVDTAGTYAVPLGDTAFGGGSHQALNTGLFAADRWLAVTVNGTPLTPWLRVGMVPVAARALDASTLGGQTLADLDTRYDARYAQLAPSAPQTGSFAVTGNVTAQAFVGNGSQLANIDAANITTGTLADARLPADLVRLSSSPVFTGAGGVTAASFSGDGAGLTGLNAGSVTSGTLGAARLPANAALLDAPAQTFTGTTTFNGATTFSGTTTLGTTTFTGTTTLADARGRFSGDGAGLTNLDLSAAKAGSVLGLAQGGTGATTATAAQAALDVPSRAGSGASGTWGIGITGNAATATKLAANGTTCASGEAAGGVDARGNATGCFTPGGGVPAGAVMYFNLSSCPTGWSALTQANGRYLVGMPTGGTLAATVGTAMTDQENRPTGNHFHQIMLGNQAFPVGFRGVGPPFIIAGDARQPTLGTVSSGNMLIPSSSINADVMSASGSSAAGNTMAVGTNAPYMQLLVCQKN